MHEGSTRSGSVQPTQHERGSVSGSPKSVVESEGIAQGSRYIRQCICTVQKESERLRGNRGSFEFRSITCIQCWFG